MINPSNVKQALEIDVQVSQPMADALTLWSKMYVNNADWLNDDPVKPVKSLQLPSAIASEIARLVTIEMKVDISGSSRAEFLSAQLGQLLGNIRQFVEKGEAKGGMVFKPFVRDGGIVIDVVQADQFYPISFDSNQNMTACIFSDQRKVGNWYYTRLEYHSFNAPNYTIRNSVFRSSSADTLGNPSSFGAVEDWKNLLEEATITNIKAPLFGYFRVPIANNIDDTSPLSVSCYSRAVSLIEQADKHWSNLIWEFVSGERAIYVDVTAFDTDSEGKPKLPNNKLYRTLNATGQIGDKNALYDEWSPEFRDASIRSGLNDILKRIEFNCGLAYGTLSDPQAIERTATEIQAAKQRSASTILDNQKSLQNAINGLLYAMDTWTTLYSLAPIGAYKASYEFDDSIVSDHDAQFQQDFQVAGANMMPDYVFLMRNYKLTEAQAKKWVSEKQAESAAAIDLFNAGGNPIGANANQGV